MWSRGAPRPAVARRPRCENRLVPIKVTDEQRLALNLIYEPFRHGGSWPEYRYVEKALHRNALEIDRVFAEVPIGLIAPDPARPLFHPQAHETLALTIAGISACDGSEADIELFLRALSFFVQLEEKYAPPPTGGSPLNAGSEQLVDVLGLSPSQAARVYALTRYEIGLFGGGGGNPDNWSFEITPEIRRFASVRTIEDYLEARIVPPLRAARASLPDLSHIRSPSPFGLSSALDPPQAVLPPKTSGWRGLLGLNRVLEHPLVSTVVGGLIVAAIVAAIYGH
jgi:hypothetical protein